jgi:hypothetical protein
MKAYKTLKGQAVANHRKRKGKKEESNNELTPHKPLNKKDN